MSSRKKSPARKSANSFKLKNPKPILIDESLCEADKCRQMCYQLAYQMARQELTNKGDPIDHEFLDAVALETVRQAFEAQTPSPGELAGLHPMMVGRRMMGSQPVRPGSLLPKSSERPDVVN